MKNIFSNILLIFKNPKYVISFLILVVIFSFLWWNFTDFENILGNNGKIYFYTDAIISWLNIIGFSLFIVAWIYRSYTLGSYAQNSERIGFLGGFLGVIISGSLCCGSSIFLVIGASAFTNFLSKYLPYGGLELKIFGVLVLWVALLHLLHNLLLCKRKNFS